jgi:hypothetical protein
MSSGWSTYEWFGPLPEAVRSRVIALAADGVGRMPVDQLPASLKRVASFASARRARVAASQIAGILETDDTFREHLAIQVRTAVSDLANALDEGVLPAAADPVEAAAVAYLLRPDGWGKVVSAAVSAPTPPPQSPDDGQLDRLLRQLDNAQAELKSTRARHRDELAALKREKAELRRKFGDARKRVRAAEDAREAADAAAAAAAEALAATEAVTDAEVRRLRARIDKLEKDLAGVRRADRVTREGTALRARLLLDTLIDSAQGLRRELALPPVRGAPADAVKAHAGEQGSRRPSGHGSMSVDDPALLDELLALPRVHVVVDGYNVTKNAWPDMSLERQRGRLLTLMGPLASRTRAEVTVVFDAAETSQRPPLRSPRGVRVLFSAPGVIADDVIRDLVAAEPTGRAVVVVTSDQAVARDVQEAGFRVVGWAALAGVLSRR